MTVTVFVGASVDGFIARKDGGIDWLPSDGAGDHGFVELLASVDAIVMGRATFELVQKFATWYYGSKRVIVLSHRPIDASMFPQARIERMEGEPRDLVARLAKEGATRLYVDGGATVQSFLRAGLVDRLVITRVPILIGEGIPLFGIVDADVPLRHVRTRELSGGLVQSEYQVVRPSETVAGRP